MLDRGLWVVLEGPDGVGKTTAQKLVAQKLRTALPESKIIESRHPGATPLGKLIRTIVKDPESLGIKDETGPLATQTLMIVDHIDFKQKILIPELNAGSIIISDRSDLISCLVYGIRSGIPPQTLYSLINVAANPCIDRLFLLQCPANIAAKRIGDRGALDKFERLTGIADAYNELLVKNSLLLYNHNSIVNKVVSYNNIITINAAQSTEEVAEKISKDILRMAR